MRPATRSYSRYPRLPPTAYAAYHQNDALLQPRQQVQQAEKGWRRIRGIERIADLLNGMHFKDGIPVPDDPSQQQTMAA